MRRPNRSTTIDIEGSTDFDRAIATDFEAIRARKLIDGLETIPSGIELVPTARKTPIDRDWQNTSYSRDELTKRLKYGHWKKTDEGRSYKQTYDGYAIRTGSGLVVIDLDGKSAVMAAAALFEGKQPEPTPAWQGNKGKSLLFRLPDDLTARVAALDSPIAKLNITDGCIKGESIELLYQGKTATIPPSAHPSAQSGEYRFIKDFGTPIAAAPQWVIDAFEAECEKREYWQSQPKREFTGTATGEDIEKWLKSVDPECDYDTWIEIGMSIKSACPDDGLDLWDGWSQLSGKYKPGDCEKRWDGLREISIDYLATLAGVRIGGGGLSAIAGGKTDAIEMSDRDRLISKRDFQYQQAKPFLDADYKLSYQPGTRRDVAYFEGRDDLDFNDVAIAKCPVIAVRGFLSVGKTHKALEAIKASVKANGKDQQFIWISTRNGLLRQTEQRAIAAQLGIPVYFYMDDVTLHRDLLETGQPGLYVITDAAFSDYHVQGIDYGPVTSIVDEWAGLRAEVISKSNVLPEFERMLSECRSLWVLDAFLGETDMRIIEKYRANRTQWAVFDQIPTKAPKTMRWIETRTKQGDISLSHDGVALTVLERWFGGDRLNVKGLPYVVVTDSLLAANAVKRAAIKVYELKEDEIILISSQTVEASHGFMPSPDAAIRAQRPRLVILTPTAQSGVDIQEPFAEGLGLFCGVLSGTQALQMIGRARQCNEWLISAPRRQIDGSGATMDRRKLAQSIKRLPQALEAAGAKSNKRTNLWSFWQTEIRQLQRQFNSEFIHDLLIEHYETVETIELENPHRDAWKELSKKVKAWEADKKLRADAENGQEMRAEKQSPSLDEHVWDIALAEAIEHYPKPVKKLVDNYADALESADQSRLDELLQDAVYWFGDGHKSLKKYVQSNDRNPEDDEALRDRQGRIVTNFATGHHIQYRNQELFRALNLEQLAKLRKEEKGREVGDDVLDVRSPIVGFLWGQFLGRGKLVRLFPNVHDVKDFWNLIKRVMSYLGFKSEGKNYRVESDKPVLNGRDRNGRQRYSKTRSAYFVGWFIRAESGSLFERENFEMTVEAIRDRLAVERYEWRSKQLDKGYAPPGEGWAAAA